MNLRSRLKVRHGALILVLGAIALSASACGAVGRVTSGDASHGKMLFLAKCASCHTLGDAKSQGQVGPNLDDAFSSDKTQGFSVQTIKDVVLGQIYYPTEPMPAELVQKQDAQDVATYVATCSGNATCGITASNAPAPGATTTGGTTTTAAPTTTTSGGSTSGGGSALAAGKTVYNAAGCGGCHTLKDAGSTGAVGPNLDTLKPSKAAVASQVTNGGGPMPAFKGQLSAAQIDAVATYVSSVAGK